MNPRRSVSLDPDRSNRDLLGSANIPMRTHMAMMETVAMMETMMAMVVVNRRTNLSQTPRFGES